MFNAGLLGRVGGILSSYRRARFHFSSGSGISLLPALRILSLVSSCTANASTCCTVTYLRTTLVVLVVAVSRGMVAWRMRRREKGCGQQETGQGRVALGPAGFVVPPASLCQRAVRLVDRSVEQWRLDLVCGLHATRRAGILPPRPLFPKAFLWSFSDGRGRTEWLSGGITAAANAGLWTTACIFTTYCLRQSF